MMAAAALSFAQGVPVPSFKIPAIREPHHFVKLDNKYVRVLDVTVPGYDSTLYHIHENPYFWVSIGDCTLRGNTLGSAETVAIEKKDGEVTWSPEVTHRVANVIESAFRNITVQIQGRDDVSPGSDFTANPKPAGYQPSAALDNKLVHIERLVLDPGQSTGQYTLPKSGILIAVHEGTIRIEAAGSAPARVSMRAGEFDWHTGPITHKITNTGKSQFEAIEAVWK
jgi:hypothetical protein